MPPLCTFEPNNVPSYQKKEKKQMSERERVHSRARLATPGTQKRIKKKTCQIAIFFVLFSIYRNLLLFIYIHISMETEGAETQQQEDLGEKKDKETTTMGKKRACNTCLVVHGLTGRRRVPLSSSSSRGICSGQLVP